jgi:hypothetical protein
VRAAQPGPVLDTSATIRQSETEPHGGPRKTGRCAFRFSRIRDRRAHEPQRRLRSVWIVTDRVETHGGSDGVSIARTSAGRWCFVLAFVWTAGFTSLPEQLSGPVRTEEPAAPGNGARLIVIAPENLCSADLELIVARRIWSGRRYVFQTPVTPPQCRWTITDVRSGDYQAVLRKARGDRRIVAISRLDVHPGSTWTTTVSPLAGTVEGLISR